MEEYQEDRKENRRASKIISKTSKERPSEQAPLPQENAPLARIVAMGSNHILADLDGTIIPCSLAGSLKKERQTISPIAIGDYVLLRGEQIVSVAKRKSFIERVDPRSPRKKRLLAANLDLLLITASLVKPKLKIHLIDRFLIAAMQGGATPIILINKVDLAKDDPEAKERLKEACLLYEKLGIPCFAISSKEPKTLKPLLALMKGKISLFAGQSGVGKTSLINALTERELATSEVSLRDEKGQHTTTQALFLPLKGIEGACIDTPGIRQFEPPPPTKDDLADAFHEISEMASGCRMRNCRHLQEPDCAVKKALASGKISPLRYESYKEFAKEL